MSITLDIVFDMIGVTTWKEVVVMLDGIGSVLTYIVAAVLEVVGLTKNGTNFKGTDF